MLCSRRNLLKGRLGENLLYNDDYDAENVVLPAKSPEKEARCKPVNDYVWFKNVAYPRKSPEKEAG